VTAAPQQPATITGEQLEALTGLTDRRIRQLAKLGYFPPPVRGVYQQVATVRGLFKYYREDRNNATSSFQEARTRKMTAEAELAQIKVAEAKHELISVPEAVDFMAHFAAKLNQLLTQKIETETPARLLGKDIVASRAEARQIHDEIWEVCNAGLNEWQPTKQNQ
jgi:hypothetical protein